MVTELEIYHSGALNKIFDSGKIDLENTLEIYIYPTNNLAIFVMLHLRRGSKICFPFVV